MLEHIYIDYLSWSSNERGCYKGYMLSYSRPNLPYAIMRANNRNLVFFTSLWFPKVQIQIAKTSFLKCLSKTALQCFCFCGSIQKMSPEMGEQAEGTIFMKGGVDGLSAKWFHQFEWIFRWKSTWFEVSAETFEYWIAGGHFQLT